MLLLSIITPFHNSKEKCKRLLETYGEIDDSQVELILVDDDSTDDTYNHLLSFKSKARCKTTVVTQENKGPGGARNYGLSLSCGEYVWFVDSDDDIRLEAIDFLKKNSTKGYDFIDFDFLTQHGCINSLGLPPGVYLNEDLIRMHLISSFRGITSKIIKKNVIMDNYIFYPENCIYEDNPLMLIYPFYVKKFCKTDMIGYLHHEEFKSVTRVDELSLRFYDRMDSVLNGFCRAKDLSVNNLELKALEERFVEIYLLRSLGTVVTRLPTKNWLMAARIIKNYRETAVFLNLNATALPLIKASKQWKMVFCFLWICSYLLPSQKMFFDNLHLEAWGKPIKFNDL